MTVNEVHHNIAGALLKERPMDNAMALMILLHTHRLLLPAPILEDRPGVTEIAPITQRHAASVVATHWSGRVGDKRADATYWYYKFNSRTPFEIVADISSEWMPRVENLRERLTEHFPLWRMEPED